MQSKNYKAILMRKTLEKTMQNLGLNTFVVETNQASGDIGTTGMNSDMQIKISEMTSTLTGKCDETCQSSKTELPPSSLTTAAADSTELPDYSKVLLPTNYLGNSNYLSNNFNDKDKAEASIISDIGPDEIHSELRNLKTVENAAVNPPSLAYLKAKEITQPNQPYLSLVPNKTQVNISSKFSSKSRELRLVSNASVPANFVRGGAIAAWQDAQSNSNIMNPDALNEVFGAPFNSAYNEMTRCGISPEIARRLIANTIPDYRSGEVKTNQLAMVALQGIFPALVKFAEDPLQSSKSTRLAIIGTTGVGKTTTIAKLAARIALRERRRVELVTLDTYRIAAVEQLRTYADIIGAGCHVVNSISELDATLRKMPARASVLIDTTGRNPHDLSEHFDLSDYLQKRDDIRKCLMIQATTDTQDAIATAKKFANYGVDCLALTKMDETCRPGALIEIAAESSLPLVYLCTGQRVPEDLQLATPESFAALILWGKNSLPAVA